MKICYPDVRPASSEAIPNRRNSCLKQCCPNHDIQYE